MRRAVLGIMIVTLALFPGVALAHTIHVPTVTYPTIQSGIDAASHEDEIIVAPGTYYESLIFSVAISRTLRSEGGPEVTIIDGSLQGLPVIYLNNLTAGETIIDGAECVSKTFPEFWDILKSIEGEVRINGG